MFRAEYKIYPEVGLVYYRIEGRAEFDKMFELYDRICSDPDFDAHFKGVADWRATISNLTRSEVIALSKYVKENQLSYGHWVSLVDSPKVTALSQIYSNVIAPVHPLDVCSTVERASAILGIDLSPYVPETGEFRRKKEE